MRCSWKGNTCHNALHKVYTQYMSSLCFSTLLQDRGDYWLGKVQTPEHRTASLYPASTSPTLACLTWPISCEEVLLMVLYSLTMERAWHVRRTLILCTRAQRSWASFCPILRSSVLMTQPRFRSSCSGSPGPGPPARIRSPCVSSSKLMGFACKTHMHSHSVMSFRSSIQRWTESTWMKCSLQPENSGRVTAKHSTFSREFPSQATNVCWASGLSSVLFFQFSPWFLIITTKQITRWRHSALRPCLLKKVSTVAWSELWQTYMGIMCAHS